MEMISFFCEHCGQEIGARADQAGQVLACHSCGQPTTVPAQRAITAGAGPERVQITEIRLSMGNAFELVTKLLLVSIPAALVVGVILFIFMAILQALI